MATALPATAFNVFRWTALGVGVGYGIVHRSALTKQAEYKRQQDEYAFKEELIKEARAEYQKRKNGSTSASTEINWEDPKSIEDAFNRLAKEK